MNEVNGFILTKGQIWTYTAENGRTSTWKIVEANGAATKIAHLQNNGEYGIPLNYSLWKDEPLRWNLKALAPPKGLPSKELSSQPEEPSPPEVETIVI